MQEIESTKQQTNNIDLQSIEIKQESLDSLLTGNQFNQQADSIANCQATVASNSSKKIDNRFQASLERQRNLLLNMEQLAIYPQHLINTTNTLQEPTNDDDKAMDTQVVDSNNNTMPTLFRQSVSLPSINEIRAQRTLNSGQIGLNYNSDMLLGTSGEHKKTASRSNSLVLNAFGSNVNGQFNESEFADHFDDEYSRLSHNNSSLYDNYDLNNQAIKMEDAFQDDKLDFSKQGPTLAELNLNDDDMMDNSTVCVNPNSVLCPSMPLQVIKNGFLMGINYTIGLTSSSSTTTTTQSNSNRHDLVASDDFSLNNHQLNHLNTSTNASTKQPQNGFIRSTNYDQQSNNQPTTGKQSYNTRKRGHNKSEGDKSTQRRTNANNQSQNNNNNNNPTQSNRVLCKLLNETNENLSNILLVNTAESAHHPIIGNAINSTGQSFIPSTSNSSHFQTTTICVAPLTISSNTGTHLASNLANKTCSVNQLSSLQNDLFLNQLQSSLNQQQMKCGLQASVRINNSGHNAAARNRNSSISTEHSFSSSHDEGFISQAEDDSDDKEVDDSQMILDPKVITGSNKQMGKTKRKRKDADKDNTSNLVKSEQDTSINRNLKKIKLEDQSKASTSTGGFTSTLSTVKEERTISSLATITSTAISKKEGEKVATKGRVNYKITKDKPIPTPTDIQQQSHFKFNDSAKLDSKPLIDEKIEDEESSDDEDDDSFYGDYDATDLLGATTSDDQQNKWSLNMGRSRKNSAQRYFWQYNVQSKGPKGTKLTTTISEQALEGSDLPVSGQQLGSDLEPLDPVFSPNCQIEGVKHAGKARRGDGNDLTANPRKLLLIGLELKKLSKIINDLTPVAEVPVNSKSNSRKEKNKLASRACRLKKKAQHEANKIKLNGLSVEYKKLSSVLNEFKKLQEKVCEQGANTSGKKLTDQLNSLIKEKGPTIGIAGKSTEFVNSILDSVSSGNVNGGLEQL